jgi:flagellar hook protein FlgE
VYDAKGQEVPVTYYFQKVAAVPTDTWNVFATANGTAISADPLDPQPLTTITFEPDGSAPTAPAARAL